MNWQIKSLALKRALRNLVHVQIPVMVCKSLFWHSQTGHTLFKSLHSSPNRTEPVLSSCLFLFHEQSRHLTITFAHLRSLFPKTSLSHKSSSSQILKFRSMKPLIVQAIFLIDPVSGGYSKELAKPIASEFQNIRKHLTQDLPRPSISICRTLLLLTHLYLPLSNLFW